MKHFVVNVLFIFDRANELDAGKDDAKIQI